MLIKSKSVCRWSHIVPVDGRVQCQKSRPSHGNWCMVDRHEHLTKLSVAIIVANIIFFVYGPPTLKTLCRLLATTRRCYDSNSPCVVCVMCKTAGIVVKVCTIYTILSKTYRALRNRLPVSGMPNTGNTGHARIGSYTCRSTVSLLARILELRWNEFDEI